MDGGKHTLSVAFINDYSDEKTKPSGNCTWSTSSWSARWTCWPRSCRGLIGSTSSASRARRSRVRQAAGECLRPLVDRAFRRPATDEEIARFAGLVEFAVAQGERYERGLQVALSAVLVSPHFCSASSGTRIPTIRTWPMSCGSMSWPRGSRTSCGAACRTRSCSTLAAKGSSSGRKRAARSKCGACWPTRRRGRWWRTSAGSGCNLRSLDEITPDPEQFPEFDEPAARRHAPRDGAVLRRRDARGPQHPGLPRRRLHVPQRAAGAALRHRRRRGRRVSAGVAERRAAGGV